MADAPTTAYTEVQVDDNSISLTLISESQDGVTIEDTERFTFDELQEMQGMHLSLHLSNESRERLSDPTGGTGGTGGGGSRESGFPEVGNLAIDKNSPPWSNDDELEVVEILPDVSADEYIIQSSNKSRVNSVVEGSDIKFHEKTVADANPDFDMDDAVIIAQYEDGDSTEYAFPSERLDW